MSLGGRPSQRTRHQAAGRRSQPRWPERFPLPVRDERIVYGARCRWWDSISKASTTASGLPCCPHCGSPLFEVGSAEQWWADVDRYEAAGHPGYRALIEWSRGRCFPTFDALRDAYEAQS